MKAQSWHRIYTDIEDMKWNIVLRRGPNKAGSSDGICVMTDPLALEYQRLERIQSHVGCHFGAAQDREHGMNAACFYARTETPAPHGRR